MRPRLADWKANPAYADARACLKLMGALDGLKVMADGARALLAELAAETRARRDHDRG